MRIGANKVLIVETSEEKEKNSMSKQARTQCSPINMSENKVHRYMTSFPRRIALLGSTGSIGRQTLDVVRCYPEHFSVVALAARSNISLLAQQVQEFAPTLTACFAETPELERAAREALPGVALGEEGLLEVATNGDVDIVVAATSGLMGLAPTLAAIIAGKTIPLANKETLVMASHLVIQATLSER